MAADGTIQEAQKPAAPDQQPFHLDPSAHRIEAIVNDFNRKDFKSGVAELKALEDTDNHGSGDNWRRHIAVINGAVNLSALGIANADQLLGVSARGDLITTNSGDNKQQFRAPGDLSVKLQASIMPKDIEQIDNTNTYRSRLATAKEMEEHPQPEGDSADLVKTIVADFNGGKIDRGLQSLKKLQDEDRSKEPEQWIRHIAAVNANIDLTKMGLADAAQILSVDDKGRLVTASKDLGQEQFRSAGAPSSIEEAKALPPKSAVLFNYGGDGPAFQQATEVDKLLKEAKEAQGPLTPGDHRLSFTTSAGEQRELDVHVPPGYDPARPMPAFYVLHNALPGGDEAVHGEMEKETNLNEKADKQGFIVVYPLAETHENSANEIAGIKFPYHSWNSPGAGMNVTYGNYDDVDYMKEASKLVDSRLNTDPNARYLLGFSEGGEFAPHVAGKMPGYWAGVGTWHPTREGSEASTNGDPMVYAQITGEKDAMLPRRGGTTDLLFGVIGDLYPRLATSEPTATFDRMAEAQGCTGVPQIEGNAKSITTTFRADQCSTGRPVTDVDERNGEHAVDGDTGDFMTRVGGWLTGSKDRSFDATQYMVETMLKYRKNSRVPAAANAPG